MPPTVLAEQLPRASKWSGKPLRLVPAVVVAYALSLILPVSRDGGDGSSGAALLRGCVSANDEAILLAWPALLLNFGFAIGVWCVVTLQWGVARILATLAVVGGLLVPAGLWLWDPEVDFDLGIGYYLWLLSFGLLTVAAWVKSR